MRKKSVFLCLTAMLPVFLVSCGNAAANGSRVELTKNGKIIEYTVEDFSASNYDIDELKSYIDEEISLYKETNSGRVRVTRDKVKNDIISLTMRYNSVDTYVLFNDVECFAGTVEEAREAGYDFSMDFTVAEVTDPGDSSIDVLANGQETVTGSEVAADDSLSVLIVETDAGVQVAGDVRYFYTSTGKALCTARNVVSVSLDEEDLNKGNLVYVVYNS